MSEATALILTATGLVASTLAAGLILGALEANGYAWGLLGVGSAALSGWVTSGVAMRYARREERAKREEIILSR